MFTTPVSVPPSPHKITLSHSLFCNGSCFAQTMGQRWSDHKFNALVNSFGTLYNPVSVFRLMRLALEDWQPNANTYLERDGYFFNYEFHSDLHAPTQEALQQIIAERLRQTRKFLLTADWIFITLGSALVYERTDTDQVVANCHRMPARQFRQRLLSTEEIREHFDAMKAALDAVNPNVRYLFTVSPVRHLRDTLERNAVSKATLRLAVEQLRQTEPERIHYFPSYEIMLDELRDYRYYAADMLHPSEVARNYIWQKLTEAYLDEEAQRFLQQWKKISAALNHRPFRPDSEAHRRFLQNTLRQLKQLGDKVDVHREIEQLEAQLR